MFGGEDDVAFVFAVFVIDHDDGPAPGNFGNCPVDGVERGGAVFPATSATGGVTPRPATDPDTARIRCTYLARASVSRLTVSPTVSSPKVVASSVAGIRPTSNQWVSACGWDTAVTVSDAPETVIEPFGQVSCHISRHSHAHGTPGFVVFNLDHGAEPVHVALHDVTVKAAVGWHAALKVDTRTRG